MSSACDRPWYGISSRWRHLAYPSFPQHIHVRTSSVLHQFIADIALDSAPTVPIVARWRPTRTTSSLLHRSAGPPRGTGRAWVFFICVMARGRPLLQKQFPHSRRLRRYPTRRQPRRPPPPPQKTWTLPSGQKVLLQRAVLPIRTPHQATTSPPNVLLTANQIRFFPWTGWSLPARPRPPATMCTAHSFGLADWRQK